MYRLTVGSNPACDWSTSFIFRCVFFSQLDCGIVRVGQPAPSFLLLSFRSFYPSLPPSLPSIIPSFLSFFLLNGKITIVFMFLEWEMKFNLRLFNSFSLSAIDRLCVIINASFDLSKESMLINIILYQETVSHIWSYALILMS